MQADASSSVLVRDGERLGIFTNTGLQRAVVDGRPLADWPVRELGDLHAGLASRPTRRCSTRSR